MDTILCDAGAPSREEVALPSRWRAPYFGRLEIHIVSPLVAPHLLSYNGSEKGVVEYR